MSIEAIGWAFKQDIAQSSAKFVLVAIANCADGTNFIAWPSADYLSQVTGQNRKTVIANIKRLVEWGYIIDTGQRAGRTGQVTVWQLRDHETGGVPNGTKNGTLAAENEDEEDAEKDGNEDVFLKQPKNGTLSKKGTCNLLETKGNNGVKKGKSTKNGYLCAKGTQKRTERYPKTGHGTVKNLSRETSRTGRRIIIG